MLLRITTRCDPRPRVSSPLNATTQLRLLGYDLLLLHRRHYQRKANGIKTSEAYAVPFKTLSIRHDGQTDEFEFLSPAIIGIKWDSTHVTCIYAVEGGSITRKTTGLFPAILATCKQISFEGTHVLYTYSQFDFRLGSSADYSRRKTSSKRLQHIVSKLHTYPSQHERWPHCTPPALVNLGLPAFIRKIGPFNASKLKSIKLIGDNVDAFSQQMPLATELLAQHCPNIHTAEVYLSVAETVCNQKGLRLADWRPSIHSEHWMNGDFGPLYMVLKSFVLRVDWLKAI